MLSTFDPDLDTDIPEYPAKDSVFHKHSLFILLVFWPIKPISPMLLIADKKPFSLKSRWC